MNEDPSASPSEPGQDSDAFGESRLPRYEAPAAESEPPSHPGVPGPLGVGQTLRMTLALYGRDLLAVWGGAAAVIIPIAVLDFVLRDISIPRGSFLYHSQLYVVAGSSDGAFVGFGLLSALLSILATLMATGAVYRIMLGRHLQHPATLAESFSFARQRMAKLFVVSVLVLVATIIGFVLIIIPGLYLLAALSVAVPVAMAENLGAGATLTRSRELVRDLWWHCFGVALSAAVIYGILDYVIADLLVKAIIHGSRSVSGFLLVSSIAQVIFVLLILPFFAGVTTVLYVDLLLRKRDPQLPALLA